MGDPKPKAPSLPKSAPKELHDFVACKRLAVELHLDQLGWVPKPKDVPEILEPEVTVTPGATAGTATVSVGYDLFSISLPIDVSNGQLNVDTHSVPTFVDGLKSGIDDWVKNFNDTMRANGKVLSGLTVNGKVVTLKKAAALVPPAQHGTTGGTTTPPSTPPTPPPPAPPAPVTPPADQSNKSGCLIGVLVLLIGMVGAGAFYFVSRDDNKTALPAPVNQVSAPQPTPPVSEAPAATSPAESPPESPPPQSPPVESPPVTDVGSGACAELGDQAIAWETAQFVAGCRWTRSISPCDEIHLPCPSAATPPLVLFDPTVQITHNGSVPDAVTGQPGPSQAGVDVLLYGSGPGTFRIVSDCGGDVLTGDADFVPGTATLVAHPLRHFGPCTLQSLQATVGGEEIFFDATLFGDHGAFNVDANPVQATPPQPFTSWFFDPPSDATVNRLVDALAVINAITNAPNPCVRLRSVDAASLNVCDPAVAPHPPTFVVGPSLTASGTFYNPLGTPNPAAGTLQQFTTAPLFDGGLFPCGPGPIALTVCGPDSPTIDDGGYLGVTVITDGPIIDATGSVETAKFELELEELSSTYTANLADQGGELSSSAGDDGTRALVRGNSITFMIPQSNLGAVNSFRISADLPDGSHQEIATTVDGAIPIPAVANPDAPAPPVETPEQFFGQLVPSLVTDQQFAIERLNPLVLEAFTADQCAAALATRNDPTQMIVVVSVGATEPWTWQLPDGRSFAVDNATAVTIDQTGAGQTQRVDAHLVLIDRHYTWFTVC